MRRSVLPLLALVLAAAGCVPKKAQTPQPASSNLVVLLPDAGKTTAGRAVVSNDKGTVDLSEAGAAVRVASGEAPKSAAVTPNDVQRIFGDALAALPPSPQHFVLYFRFDSEELTDESRRLVQDVLTVVKQRSDPEVVAIGHTDTTGTPIKNVELGLRRANAVRTLLIDAGLPAASVAVRSHGEGALLVQTADGVFEPRNRRVEITVR
ncbi:MAG TPA: OmpA family protein [Vicinamibacterales bacterium]|jgi:outer membrane protein OmpA-like peptidoglycan-associated protein|nr:OmpA family protein [Vicinamibacterales bacterium]